MRSEDPFVVSKNLPERSKRLSRGLIGTFCVDAAIQTPFWSHFGQTREALGPLKSGNFVIRPQSFEISPFSARVASGTRFGTLPGSVWGASGPSRCLQDRLKGAQDTPKSTQEASKTTPRAPENPPIPPQDASKTAPRGIQETKKLQDACG